MCCFVVAGAFYNSDFFTMSSGKMRGNNLKKNIIFKTVSTVDSKQTWIMFHLWSSPFHNFSSTVIILFIITVLYCLTTTKGPK